MARYFRLSDGRKVTAQDDAAVKNLLKWGQDNGVGLSEVYHYRTPEGKDWTVEAWAKDEELKKPHLRGAINVGEQESEAAARDKLYGGGVKPRNPLTKPNMNVIAESESTQLGGTYKPPPTPKESFEQLSPRAQSAIKQRDAIVQEMEDLAVARPPAGRPDLLEDWEAQYETRLNKLNFLQDTIIPYRVTGLNAAQRELADSAAKWADKYPALAATVGELGMGLWGAVTSPYNFITAGMGRANEAYYGIRQGIGQGLADEGTWNDVGSGFYSFGLVAPLTIGTIMSGGASAPVWANAMAAAGTATMQMSITSDIMRELYQNDNYLSFREAGAAALSGAAQQLTENLSLSFQTKALTNAFKIGGQAGLRTAASELVRKAVAPTLAETTVGVFQTFGTEILEENLQWAEDAVIQNVMLGKPMPTWEETKQAVRDNTIGALFGVVLQSGGIMGVQAIQSKTSAQALAKLAAPESGWTSPALAQQAIDQLKAGSITEAVTTAQKAHQALIQDDPAMDDKAKRHVLRAISNVYDAGNMFDAQTAANVFIEEKAAKKELAALEQEKRKLEKAIPSQQTEDKLFLLNEKIEEADAELVRLQGVITENAQQKEIYNLLVEGSQAEQKARKAGDKAVDKLVKTKEYKEATPEQQRQMMKDAVLSDKKSAKLQEKADQKYRDADLYKLRQTLAYKQAAPEVQTQMEEAELQRQQEARDADIKAAEQRAIKLRQEQQKAAETASDEATEDSEIVPDIIDQLEAKKAALRQERQDINKELNEYRKLMDQQGGWLPSVTPEQKKAYHEVKKRQKEVNRKLNEVGIEIRKEKAARKKAEREAQKPKKKVDKKDTKKDIAESEDKDGQKDKERVSSDQRQDTKSDEQQRDDRGESAGTGQADRQGGQDEGGEAGAEEKPKQRKTYVKTKSGGKTRVFEATRIEGEWIYYTNERGTESRTKRNPRTQTTNDPLVYRKWKSEHANRSRGAQRAAQKRDRRLTMSQKVLDSMPNLAALQGRVFPPGEAGDLKNVFIPGYGPLCRESKNDQEWTYDTIYENSIPTPEGAQASRDADYKPILEAAEKELDRWYDGRQTQDTDYWDEAQKAQEEIEYYEKELDKATTEEERQLIRQKLTELDGRVFDDYTEAEQMEMEEAESDGVELNDQGYPASWDEAGTDTRTKSEALQETLPTIPDKTADDALLGMVKSHILSITRKDRTTTVNFKDGRKLVINHITQEAMMTEAGKTGVMYAGRTQGEKGKNVYKAIVDLVDGLNQGNRTLFHESFHVVWKLFLNSEQISYINQYYRAKANKGELVRKYVVTRQGTEMALYWTKEQFNALNRERQAEALEEGAAYGFEHWLGSRTDTAPTTMIGKLWQRLADAIRHALVKLNLASQNAKLTDIFHDIASDKLTGEGDMSGGARNMLSDVYHGSGAFFDRFDVQYIGTGEGAQAFGWGIYVTEKKNVAKTYSDKLGSEYMEKDAKGIKQDLNLSNARLVYYAQRIFGENKHFGDSEAIIAVKRALEAEIKRVAKIKDFADMEYTREEYLSDAAILRENVTPDLLMRRETRNLYTVDVWENRQEDVLEWDKKPTKEQYEKINRQAKAEKFDYSIPIDIYIKEAVTAKDVYEEISGEIGSDKAASKFLLRAGIDGIKYPINALSGGKGEKGYNYVVFDADQIQIKDHTRYKPVPNAAEIAEADRQYAEVEAKYKGKTYYRATTPGDTRKIKTDRSDWDQWLFVSQKRESVKYYGDQVSEVTIKPSANTLREGTSQFARIFGSDKKYISAPNKYLDWLADGTNKAKDAGYDVVEFERDSDVGTVILNKDIVGVGDQWLKAPNGKPSNLNERQWVQVRTPNFKQFFGNWEISALTSHYKKQIAELRSLFSPSILLGVVQSVPNKSIINSLQTYSKQFSDFLESKSLAPESIGKINIDSAVINKMLGLTAIDNEILDAVIRLIPVDVVNNFARQKLSIEELLHDKAMLKNILTISEDSAVTPLVDKASAVSLIDAIATKTAELSRLIEVMFKLGSALEAPADALFYVFHKEDINSDRANLSSTILRRFGDWENDPKNASKVVDENGEPLVVYHGGTADNMFSIENIGDNFNVDTEGFFFTTNIKSAERYANTTSYGMPKINKGNIIDAYLNIRQPIVREIDYDSIGEWDAVKDEIMSERNADSDGVSILAETGESLYVAFSPTQIKSATANVGTFDSENPDIRYRKLNDRERALRDEVWAEIMGRPQKLRAETKPRVQTEPPERGQERKTEPPRPQPTRPSQSNPPTEAEIDVLSERIGKDLGIAPAQVKEKLGRQMMAAWREAQGDVSRLMESAAIRNFEEWVENNKPEGTDKKDLVWHWEEMLEYAAKVGLSREQIAQMVKSDRFDATAIGINLFQRMNYIGKLLVETEATLSDRNWGTPAEREQMEAQYGILQAQFDELQAAYAMQGSEAGTVLWTRRQNKAQYLENLTRAAQALESKINRGAVELGEMRQELDGLERTISDLEKSFEMLLRVMDGKRYKDITEMNDAELEAERQKQAERLNDLRNRAEHLKYAIEQKVAAMQADKGRQEETQTQIRKIRKTGRKAKVIEIKERKPDVHDWIRAAWYNSVLAGAPTHMINMSANVVNSLLEDVATLFTQGGRVAGAQFAEKVRALFSNYEQLDPKTGEKIKTGAFAKAKEEFASPQEFSKKNEVILKGNKFFMGIQFSTKFLGAEDMLAFFPNERGMLKSLAFDESKRTGRSVADLMENPTADMLRQAYYEAKRNTFNQNPEQYVGVLIDTINKFYGALDQSGGGGKAIGNLIRFNVLPFTRVLGNVLNATIDYTPLGMIRYFAYKSDNPNSLLNRQRKDQNGRPLWLDENGDPMVSPFRMRDARRQAARVALGTILGSLLYFLAMSADDDDDDKWFISGAGPQNYKKYKQLMAAGWRPYSIHIGNAIISYKEWPVSGAFAVVGNLHDIQKYDGKTRPQDWMDKTIYATMGVASSFLDRSFASNAISTATAFDRNDPNWVKRSLTSTTSSTIIPYNNMLRFIENTYNRNLYAPETIAQQAWASVPLVPKKGLPRRVNVFGMYERKDPATARLAMTDNVGLVVPDTQNTRKIFRTVRKNNLFLSETTKRELRVDPYVGKRGIPEEDKQHIWLQGKDHENFRVMRGTEYVRLLNESENYNLIMKYDKDKDKDEMAALLTSLGRKATAYATEETLKAYQRGELKHKYKTYNKSKEEE